MRAHRLLGLVSAVIFASSSLCAQNMRQSDPLGSAVRIDAVHLSGVESDRIVLVAKAELNPERSIHVKSLSFSAMKVNDTPVYLSPIQEDLSLKKGEPYALPDVQITLYYRDLNTLAPVRRILDEQKVSLSGQLTVYLQATVLEELALHSTHPRIVLPFEREMPVDIPGGEIGRRAALTTIDLLGQVAPSAGSLIGGLFPGQGAGWRNDLTTTQAKHLLLIKTSYNLMDAGTSYPMQSYQLGFWIGESTALVPYEAVRPWEFDPETQARLSSKKTHLESESIVIAASPVLSGGTADSAAWTSNFGDLTVETDSKPGREHAIPAGAGKTTEVRLRDSTANYAILHFREGIVGNPVVEGPASGSARWDRLAVFRLDRERQGEGAHVEVVLMPGSDAGGRVKLGQPIDETAFGSPVLTEDGAIAMVQDENSAMLLTSIKKRDKRAK